MKGVSARILRSVREHSLYIVFSIDWIYFLYLFYAVSRVLMWAHSYTCLITSRWTIFIFSPMEQACCAIDDNRSPSSCVSYFSRWSLLVVYVIESKQQIWVNSSAIIAIDGSARAHRLYFGLLWMYESYLFLSLLIAFPYHNHFQIFSHHISLNIYLMGIMWPLIMMLITKTCCHRQVNYHMHKNQIKLFTSIL